MGRSKMQGSPWHYEYHPESIAKCDHSKYPSSYSRVKPYEYSSKHKECHFISRKTCTNPDSKNYKNECRGFELCRDFTLTGEPPKTYKSKKKDK